MRAATAKACLPFTLASALLSLTLNLMRSLANQALISGILAPLLGSMSVGSAVATDLMEREFIGEVSRTVGYRYLLALPEGYEADTSRQWPLLVFLHGAGERGDNLEVLKKHGPPRLIAEGKDLGMIVVSPQCRAGQLWDPLAVKALTDDIAATFRVDHNRIYLSGLSMGGFGTWETAIEFPDTYAALVPICGGAGVRWLLAERIKSVPVWIFHGAKDTVVEPEQSQRMADMLKRVGAPVKFTLYPDASHDSWTPAYNDPELWSWLLKQRR